MPHDIAEGEPTCLQAPLDVFARNAAHDGIRPLSDPREVGNKVRWVVEFHRFDPALTAQSTTDTFVRFLMGDDDFCKHALNCSNQGCDWRRDYDPLYIKVVSSFHVPNAALGCGVAATQATRLHHQISSQQGMRFNS